jgi:hypothetical protein
LVKLYANSNYVKTLISNHIKDPSEVDSIKKDVKSYENLLVKYNNMLSKSKNIDFYHNISFSEYKEGLGVSKLFNSQNYNKQLIDNKKKSVDKIIGLLNKQNKHVV